MNIEHDYQIDKAARAFMVQDVHYGQGAILGHDNTIIKPLFKPTTIKLGLTITP